MLLDAKADLLVVRQRRTPDCRVAHRAAGNPIHTLHRHSRHRLQIANAIPEGWSLMDSTSVDTPGNDPATGRSLRPRGNGAARREQTTSSNLRRALQNWTGTDGGPPAGSRQRQNDPVLYAHAWRVLHLETNPGNARAGATPRRPRRVDQPAANPADHAGDGPALYELPYTRRSASGLRQRQDSGLRDDPLLGFDSAWLFRRLHVLSSITEHEGRIIQNRSEAR